jgi:acid phosphatase
MAAGATCGTDDTSREPNVPLNTPAPTRSGPGRRRVRRLAAVLGGLAVIVTAAAGCGSGSGGSGDSAAGAPPSAGSTASAGASSSSGARASLGTTTGHSPTSATTGQTAALGADGIPRLDHIVVVVLENKPLGSLIDNTSAPFLNRLTGSGAVLTQSYAIAHPSQPNYLALFSGSTQAVTSDACPQQFDGPNLAQSLIDAGKTFVGYSESMPSAGYLGCSAHPYARKHNPWADFSGLPESLNQPFTAFPTDYSQLPTVAFVIPNLDDDMHDGTITQGDQWLAANLSSYVSWAPAHNSVLIVTTDEDDNSHDNQIATLVAGAHVLPGRYDTRTDHYGVLRTILDSQSLEPIGNAAQAAPISEIWAP